MGTWKNHYKIFLWIPSRYPEARGVLEYIDGQYLRSYAFASGSMGKSETFTISALELAQLYKESGELRERLQSGEYTVVESHVCLNDPLYVLGMGSMPMLTEYARLHVDECCLKFQVEFPERYGTPIGDGVLFREEHTLELAFKTRFIEKSTYIVNKKRPYVHYCDKRKNEDTNESNNASDEDKEFESIQSHIGDIVFNIQLIDEQIKSMNSFSSALKYLMYENQVTRDKLHEITGISVSTIDSYRGNTRKPKLHNLFLICIALHLPYKVSCRLINLAGLSLTSSSEDSVYEFILCNYYSYSFSFCEKMLQLMLSEIKKQDIDTQSHKKK